MQSFDYISEKLGVSPTLDPFLGMCRTLRADLRIDEQEQFLTVWECWKSLNRMPAFLAPLVVTPLFSVLARNLCEEVAHISSFD